MSYDRLLFAYPKRYRAERGRELADMYREITGDDRPQLADAADLLIGGLRERLRAVGLGGLTGAFPIAAVCALAAFAGLSVYYLAVFELRPAFQTVYVGVYVGWLVTAVLAAIRPGRLARTAAGVTFAWLLISIGLRFGGLTMPTLRLYMALPMAVLALTALALPSNPSRTGRFAPLVVAAVTGLAVAVKLPLGPLWDGGVEWYGTCCYYQVPSQYALHLAGIGLLLTGLVLVVVRRSLGAWTLLVLASPIAALGTMWFYGLMPVTRFADRIPGQIEFEETVVGVLVLLVTVVVLPLLVSLVRRIPRLRPRPTTD